MRFLKPIVPGALFVILWSISGSVFAFGSCAPCFQSGFQFACATCASATNGAMATINGAIAASETAILAATGVVPPNPAVGFPALSDTISGSTGQQTDQLVSALEAFGKSITTQIKSLPAYRAEMENNTKLAQSQFLGAKQSCAAVNYGIAQGATGESSLGTGFRFLQGASLAANNEDGIGAGIDNSMSSAEASAALISNISRQAAAHVGSKLRVLRAQANRPDVGATELLEPSLLLSQDNLVLSEEADETGLSESEKMDLLIKYLTVDRPSAERFLQSSASTPAALNKAAEESIIAMETSLSMAVLDKMIKGRRKLAGTVGSEDYLREVVANRAPSGAASSDEFTYLTTHYRINDPEWIAQIELNEDYAVKQIAQMEAERLALKYKRWSMKRDINILLSQIVANKFAEERP